MFGLGRLMNQVKGISTKAAAGRWKDHNSMKAFLDGVELDIRKAIQSWSRPAVGIASVNFIDDSRFRQEHLIRRFLSAFECAVVDGADTESLVIEAREVWDRATSTLRDFYRAQLLLGGISCGPEIESLSRQLAWPGIEVQTRVAIAAVVNTQRIADQENAENLIESLQRRISPDSTPPNSWEERLQAFIAAHPGTTLADVRYSAQVHKPEFRKWRSGELPEASVMSRRIEDVLAGRRRLQKKPRQQRPD